MYVRRQPKLPAGMGTWLKLADRSVWAHGNTRKGGEKKRKRLPESSATAAAPLIRNQDALFWFPFYPLCSDAGTQGIKRKSRFTQPINPAWPAIMGVFWTFVTLPTSMNIICIEIPSTELVWNCIGLLTLSSCIFNTILYTYINIMLIAFL